MKARNALFPHITSTHHGKRQGLSLIEVLIGMFVLGLILLPLFGLFSQSSAVVRIGRHDIEAMNFGSSVVSQARKFLPRHLICTRGEVPLPPIQSGMFRLGPAGAENEIAVPSLDQSFFHTTYSISDFTISPTNDGILREAKQLIVKIAWKESLGKDKSTCFTALVISDSVPVH